MSKPIFIFLTGVFLLLIGLASKGLFLSLFSVQQLHCQLVVSDIETESCPEELVNQLQALQGTSLFWTRFEEQIDQMGLELYQLVDISKYLPNTLELRFVPTKTVYVIKSGTDDQSLRVTQSGRLALDVHDTAVPEVRLHDTSINLTTGQQLDQKLHAVLNNLASYLEIEQLPVKTIDYYQSGFIVVHLEADTVAIVDEQLNHGQIKKLKRILSELDRGAVTQPIREIDLRFNLPVLRTSQTNPG